MKQNLQSTVKHKVSTETPEKAQVAALLQTAINSKVLFEDTSLKTLL